jgi:hypothetical protein
MKSIEELGDCVKSHCKKIILCHSLLLQISFYVFTFFSMECPLLYHVISTLDFLVIKYNCGLNIK